MNKPALLAALLCPLLSLTSPAARAQDKDWKLVWSDEFDRDGLPDPAKWVYEQGFLRNQEVQFYTEGRKKNARVEGGNLILEGRKENYPVPAGAPNAVGRDAAEYTAASLTTEGKASWRYGRLEVRAKIPGGKGTWPAFWTLGTNIRQVGWPECGEIDVLEFVGKEQPVRLHSTVHYEDRAEGKKRSAGNRLEVPDAHDEFHRYTVEWDEHAIRFLMDDRPVGTSFDVDKAGLGEDNPFRKPHYLLVNLALGGTWGGPVIDAAALPQQYVIDYVRVYQRPGGR